MAQSVISELLARRGPLPVQPALPEPEPAQPTAPNAQDAQASTAEPAERAEPRARRDASRSTAEPGAAFTGTSRVSTGTFSCRYAGAMLLHAYLDRVDAQAIFATLAGGPARRYDDLAVLMHRDRSGSRWGSTPWRGPSTCAAPRPALALGLTATPQLAHAAGPARAPSRTAADPLALQRAFAARMLAADPAGDPVYFVDDHFVPYAGARPVGKGWNTKRRHAEPGRDDTLLVDARGRAVVFGSGEPTGLSTTPARRAGPAAGGDRPARAGAARVRPRRRLPGRLHRVPGRGRALGHLPARPTGRDDRHTQTLLDRARRQDGSPWSWPTRRCSSRGTARPVN